MIQELCDLAAIVYSILSIRPKTSLDNLLKTIQQSGKTLSKFREIEVLYDLVQDLVTTVPEWLEITGNKGARYINRKSEVQLPIITDTIKTSYGRNKTLAGLIKLSMGTANSFKIVVDKLPTLSLEEFLQQRFELLPVMVGMLQQVTKQFQLIVSTKLEAVNKSSIFSNELFMLQLYNTSNKLQLLQLHSSTTDSGSAKTLIQELGKFCNYKSWYFSFDHTSYAFSQFAAHLAQVGSLVSQSTTKQSYPNDIGSTHQGQIDQIRIGIETALIAIERRDKEIQQLKYDISLYLVGPRKRLTALELQRIQLCESVIAKKDLWISFNPDSKVEEPEVSSIHSGEVCQFYDNFFSGYETADDIGRDKVLPTKQQAYADKKLIRHQAHWDSQLHRMKLDVLKINVVLEKKNGELAQLKEEFSQLRQHHSQQIADLQQRLSQNRSILTASISAQANANTIQYEQALIAFGYTEIREIAQGGFSVVFCCKKDGIEYAVKTPLKQQSLLPEFQHLERLKAGRALNAQFVVDYVDTVKLCDRTAIVMPYYKHTLQEVIREGLNEKLVLKWAAFIFKGIASAHSPKQDVALQYRQGIAHCDLKPANIFIDGKFRPVIADWGLATAAHTKPSGGTRSYIDPKRQQITKDLRPSDIWSLGIILYEMIEGRYPFAENYLLQLYDAPFNTYVQLQFKKSSGHLQELVKKMLLLDPKRRPTIGELERDPLITYAIRKISLLQGEVDLRKYIKLTLRGAQILQQEQTTITHTAQQIDVKPKYDPTIITAIDSISKVAKIHHKHNPTNARNRAELNTAMQLHWEGYKLDPSFSASYGKSIGGIAAEVTPEFARYLAKFQSILDYNVTESSVCRVLKAQKLESMRVVDLAIILKDDHLLLEVPPLQALDKHMTRICQNKLVHYVDNDGYGVVTLSKVNDVQDQATSASVAQSKVKLNAPEDLSDEEMPVFGFDAKRNSNVNVFDESNSNAAQKMFHVVPYKTVQNTSRPMKQQKSPQKNLVACEGSNVSAAFNVQNQQEAILQCVFCSKLFADRAGIRQHRYRVHGNGYSTQVTRRKHKQN